MPPVVPPLFDEARVKRALVHVLTDKGGTSGTGFFVGERDVITCHHVVHGLIEPIQVKLHDGHDATARLDRTRSCPEADLGVLVVDQEAPDILPCGTRADLGHPVWATGYHQPSEFVKGPVPTPAIIGGRVDVESPNEPRYAYDGFEMLNAHIRPGISGGPVLDAETGVVVGLVGVEQFQNILIRRDSFTLEGSQIDGLAIDLAYLANRHPPFGELLRANRDRIAAYGRHLNAPGARDLCRRQRELTLEELLRTRYDRAKYTVREAERQVTDFLASTQKVLPVVGNTGVGKTCLLGHLADELPHRGHTVVVLRGFHVRLEAGGGLAENLHTELARLGASRFKSLDLLFTAIDPKALVVLFDALNEIPYSDLNVLRSWWVRSIAWIARTNVRLILTSRQRTWDFLCKEIGSDLCYCPFPTLTRAESGTRSSQASEGLPLGPFTPDEYQAAITRYGVADPQWDLARHPFFLWVWSRLRPAQATNQRPSPHDLLAAYVEEIKEQVSQSTGDKVSKAQVDRLLKGLGQDALAARSNVIRVEVAEARFQLQDEARRAMIAEHVLEEDETHFRFAFDTLAEYLMAWNIDLAQLSAEYLRSLSYYGQDSKGNAIGFAILRAEHQGQSAIVESALKRFVEDPNIVRNMQIGTLARLFTDFRKPEAHFQLLRDVAKRVGTTGPWWSGSVEGVARLLRSQRLPLGDVLDLLRPAFVHDDPYRYEWGHWSAWTTRQFEEDCGFPTRNTPAAALLSAFDDQPELATKILVDWLADQTPFADRHSVTIGAVAAAILYHRRSAVFDRLCNLLGERTFSSATALLGLILQSAPDQAVDILERWSALDEERYDRQVIRFGELLIPKGGDVADATRRAQILDIVWRRTVRRAHETMEAFTQLLRVLALSPSHRDLAFNVIDQNLPMRWPEFCPSMLRPYVADRWPDLLPIIDRCLESHSLGLPREVALLLKEFTATPDQTQAAVERLDRLVTTHDEGATYAVGRAIEDLLRLVPTGNAAREAVLKLARRCIREGGENARKCVLHYTGSDSRQPKPQELREIGALVTICLETETAPDNQDMLIKQLQVRLPTFADLLDALRPLSARIPPETFERAVVRTLRFSDQHWTPDYFAKWVVETAPTSVGQCFGALLYEAASCASPTTAIRRAFESTIVLRDA
jgi:hypothetical protein